MPIRSAAEPRPLVNTRRQPERCIVAGATVPAPFGSVHVYCADGESGVNGVAVSLEQAEATLRLDLPWIREAVRQLEAYFSKPLQTGFCVPIVLRGTDFQRRVWAALQEIPSGTTLTYGALAARLQSGPRAVARACRENPLPILIPCHRIVAADGIGGYCGVTDNGPWIDVKRWLLRHEGVGGAL